MGRAGREGGVRAVEAVDGREAVGGPRGVGGRVLDGRARGGGARAAEALGEALREGLGDGGVLWWAEGVRGAEGAAAVGLGERHLYALERAWGWLG